MKIKKLIFPVVVSSLFMPSIEAIERTTDLNSLEQENNIYEEVDILIAEGGGGKKSGQQQENIEKNKEKAKEAAKRRLEEKKKKEAKTEVEEIIPKFEDGLFEEKYREKIIKIIYSKIDDEFINVHKFIEQLPELYIEDDTAPYILNPFFRCVAFTEKALEAKENGNLKKANTYAELAIKSVVREKNILEKQGRQIKEKSIDPELLENIEYSLLGINSIILDDYKNGNRYMKKALKSKNQDSSNLKSLIAYTDIINGKIDQGCSNYEELLIDGTIDLVDVDFILEDICRRLPEE